MQTTCQVIEAGIVPYQQAWDIQRTIADARAAGEIEDTLLLLEHPHTYTLGRAGNIENLLLNEEERAERGVSVFEVDRGGDITYHGPGQLVIYPIRYLGKPDASGRLTSGDYIGYIRGLEAVIIRVLANYGISGRREEGYTGVWVDQPAGPEKVAAIGVKISSKGISTHGAALNVNTDLSYFTGIIPCGISDRPVTSLQKLMGKATPQIKDVIEEIKMVYSEVFDCWLTPVTLAEVLVRTD